LHWPGPDTATQPALDGSYRCCLARLAADYPLTSAPHYAGSGHPGSYRLADGTWHAADIGPTGQADRVLMRPGGCPALPCFCPTK
jgi:hypothetical protein